MVLDNHCEPLLLDNFQVVWESAGRNSVLESWIFSSLRRFFQEWNLRESTFLRSHNDTHRPPDHASIFFSWSCFFFGRWLKWLKQLDIFYRNWITSHIPLKSYVFFCSTSFTNKISIWQLSDVKRTYQKKVFESPRTAPCSQNRWHMISKKEYKPICIGTVRNVFFIFFCISNPLYPFDSILNLKQKSQVFDRTTHWFLRQRSWCLFELLQTRYVAPKNKSGYEAS